MKFKKIFSSQLDACYALVRLKNENHDFLLVASELDEPCYAFDLNNQFKKIIVWPSVGGTMTLVQIPGTLDFLATQKFYPGFNSKNCQIVRGRFNGHNWNIEVLMKFPYLHRFTLVEENEKLLFVGCTIAKSKKFIDDWSDPGEVIVGEFNEIHNCIENLKSLNKKITKNHGFHYDKANKIIYITGVEGVFSLERKHQKEWKFKEIFNQETSDVYNTDINQDGKNEFISIQGFHGPNLTIYSEDFTQTIYQNQEQTPFGHAIWGGNLYGNNYFIFGNREGKQNLFLIEMHSGLFHQKVIDSNVGSSNVLVIEKKDKYYVASANNSNNELAMYEIENGGK